MAIERSNLNVRSFGVELLMPRIMSSDAILFDLDNTLCPVDMGLMSQIENEIIKNASLFLEITLNEAEILVKKYFNELGSSISGLFSNYDIDKEEFLFRAHQVDFSVIVRDDKLIEYLNYFGNIKKVVFTNAPKEYARKVLKKLEILEYFENVICIEDLDFCYKPHPNAFASVIRILNLDPKKLVLVDDCLRSIKTGGSMGMMTVHISKNCDMLLKSQIPSDFTMENVSEFLKLAHEYKIKR